MIMYFTNVVGKVTNIHGYTTKIFGNYTMFYDIFLVQLVERGENDLLAFWLPTKFKICIARC